MQFKFFFDKIQKMATYFIKLNRPLLDEFRLFLDQKESKLADQLLLSTPMLPGHRMEKIPLHGSGHLRLAQALQILGTRVRGYKEEQISNEEWRASVVSVNHSLWEYTDLLQDTVQEFIFQLQQTNLNSWNHNFFIVASSFKELILHRIEDLIWTYRRLDELFLTYRAICQKRKHFLIFFEKIFSKFSNVLDRSILNHLFRSEELLSMHYKRFSMDYEAFSSMLAKEKDEEAKFQHFQCLKELPQEQRELFTQLHHLIKIAEENRKISALKSEDLTTAIKNLAKAGKVSLLFRNYAKELKRKLFDTSEQWKIERDLSLKERTEELIIELSTLANLVRNYREVWLRSATTPYLRTRWSFTEWIVGPEPRKTKDLKVQLYEIETLSTWYQSLLQAIKNPKSVHLDTEKTSLFMQMDEMLHEMGQPLSSRNHIARHAEKLIDLIQKADELGGSYGPVQELLTKVFLRALRMDSKYQVLHDFLQFENLYAIHRGFLPPIDEPSHEKRIKMFNQLIHRIQYWLKEHLLAENYESLEMEEAAIQEEFQKFLARLQNENISDEEKNTYSLMLLEYRYTFSCFFHSLRTFETEGKEIRSQFTFVDQYLDAIENKLNA